MRTPPPSPRVGCSPLEVIDPHTLRAAAFRWPFFFEEQPIIHRLGFTLGQKEVQPAVFPLHERAEAAKITPDGGEEGSARNGPVNDLFQLPRQSRACAFQMR